MPPWDAPIFMAPLAGMIFLVGNMFQQVAGRALEDKSTPTSAWVFATFVGMALQFGAFLILVSL